VKVRWTSRAENDRAEIMDYIAEDNVRAAIAMDELFDATAARLAEFPMLGQPGRVVGTRELVPHESYPLVYEVNKTDDTVWVLALVHTARRWPPAQ